jgi:hypothetical protein
MKAELCLSTDILVHYSPLHCSRIAIQIIDPDDSWSPSSADAINCNSEHSIDETETWAEQRGGHSGKGHTALSFCNFLPLTRAMTDHWSVVSIVQAAFIVDSAELECTEAGHTTN